LAALCESAAIPRAKTSAHGINLYPTDNQSIDDVSKKYPKLASADTCLVIGYVDEAGPYRS
jgi:hypothetical protein